MPVSVSALPTPSIRPICPYFYQCGGCSMQDVPYAQQTAYKEQYLSELFRPLSLPSLPIMASIEEYPILYRNKIRFSFVVQDGRVRPSRHRKDGPEEDIAVSECFLQSESSNEIINWIADYATESCWIPFSPETGTGWLKHVLIRQGKRTGETMVGLVTTEKDFAESSAWADALVERFPDVVSIIHTRTVGRDNFDTVDTILGGVGHIHETIGSHTYRISQHAFFQTNSDMVETLYDSIRARVRELRPKHLWDLYAGSATIGIHVRPETSQVHCIESNPHNIEDAAWNIRHNGITGVTMHAGEVETVAGDLFRTTGKPDMVIVDPARAGLSEKSRTLLSGIRPKHLIYVSCNPLTLLRDVKDLSRRGFVPLNLQAIDMFPHTPHCEAILQLDAR